MEKNESDILDKIGKEPGFKVPENYFADFAKEMSAKLPERDFHVEDDRTLWQRMRPWVYMAAMFGGIWCTLYVFTSITGGQSKLNPAIAEAVSQDTFVDEFVLTSDFDEYTLMQELYDDNVNFSEQGYVNANLNTNSEE